jgi:hypothetical protein
MVYGQEKSHLVFELIILIWLLHLITMLMLLEEQAPPS